MPKPLSDDTARFLQFSPYFALTEGKTDEQLARFDASYDALPEPIRRFLLDPTTADAVSQLETLKLMPPTHRTAVSKLLGMAVMEDVRPDQVKPLLVKLGISDTNATAIADRFMVLMKPLLQIRAVQRTRDKLSPLPPLTQRLSPPGQTTPARVLDLRNHPEP